LVGFDAFKFPIVTFKYKVKINFCIAGELDFNVFGELMFILYHYFDAKLLRLLQSLDNFRFLLNFDEKGVLFAIYYLA
jgi:hypothetical protein